MRQRSYGRVAREPVGPTSRPTRFPAAWASSWPRPTNSWCSNRPQRDRYATVGVLLRRPRRGRHHPTRGCKGGGLSDAYLPRGLRNSFSSLSARKTSSRDWYGTSLLFARRVGIYSAIRQDTIGDYGGRTVAITFLSVPVFWMATMVVLYPSRWWGWSPSVRLCRTRTRTRAFGTRSSGWWLHRWREKDAHRCSSSSPG